MAIGMWLVVIIGALMFSAAVRFSPRTYRYAKFVLRRMEPASQLDGEDALPEATRVLFITSAPGEAEFACGGTLPKLLARGNELYLAILTDGKPPVIPIESFRARAIENRRYQQRKASRVAGFKDALFYGFPVGSLTDNVSAAAVVSTLVNELKPGAVFAFDPEAPAMASDSPAGGAIAGLAVARATQITEVFYYMTERPNIIIDISDAYDAKLRLLSHFERRVGWGSGLQRAFARISERYGKALNVKYAEGYLVRVSPKGVR